MGEHKITSIDEYRGKHRKVVKTSGGDTWHIKALSAYTTVGLMALFPRDGIKNEDMPKFVMDNLRFIIDQCIIPSIIEPKIDADDIQLNDAVEILVELIDMTGLGEANVNERESFRKDAPSPVG